MKRKAVRRFFLAVFIVVFIISSYEFTGDVYKCYKVKSEYRRIRDKMVDETGKEKIINWKELLQINKDIVCWIEIPGTPVDYPVVQTTNNQEYLAKDIYGRYSIYGAVFLDERLYDTKLGKNPNNIIYAHNMGRWTDVMFSSLKNYLDASYFKGHEKVILYAPEKTYRYQIASVLYASQSFSVYDTEFKNISFNAWVKEQISNSIYPCSKQNVTDYSERFRKGKLDENIRKCGNTLTLSTCDTTHNTDKKIVVFCIPDPDIS